MRRESRGQEADETGMLASKLSIRNCGRLAKRELKRALQQGLINCFGRKIVSIKFQSH